MRWTAIAAIAGAAILFGMGWLTFAMPGMDHGATSASSMPGMDHPDGRLDWTRQSVDQFAETMTRSETVVINVHVPDEGSIPGTELAIPYDQIVGDGRLPSDRSTAIALYCRTGRMSTVAAQALTAAGYTDLVELDGGMDAWGAAGAMIER